MCVCVCVCVFIVLYSFQVPRSEMMRAMTGRLIALCHVEPNEVCFTDDVIIM